MPINPLVAQMMAMRESLSDGPMGGSLPPVVQSLLGRIPAPRMGVQAPMGAPAAGGDWRSSLSPAEAWIIQKESSFRPDAKNPTSTAFGLWQGLAATRKRYLGNDWQTTDPVKQIDAFRRYVKDRYGTAEKAQQFHQRNNWY